MAVSTWSLRRSRFGIAESLDGIHIIAQEPIRKFAMNSQIGVPTMAIDRNRAQRAMSHSTMTLRRSNLSARIPPIGAKSSPGSSWVSTTPANAKLCAS